MFSPPSWWDYWPHPGKLPPMEVADAADSTAEGEGSMLVLAVQILAGEVSDEDFSLALGLGL